MEMTSFEFESWSKKIQKQITEPCTLDALLLKMEGDQEKIRRVVNWLLDNNKVTFRIDNKLEWNENS